MSERRTPGWFFVLAGLMGLIYAVSLPTRFDFIDDGDLVYPTGQTSLAEHARFVWQRTVSNVEHLGPFRPFLHLFWHVEAEWFEANPLAWRAARMGWAMLASGLLFWLLRELGMRPGACLAATALAIWNPYRNEIWTSLTLAEGVAMPFALFGLIAAARAPGARRAWVWDLGGALAVLAALGCKNTFAALVPVQVFLRAFPAGIGWREGLCRHGWRAALLAVTLAVPVGHYLHFRMNWHEGQYVVKPASLAFLGQYFWSLAGAVSIAFTAPALVLGCLALWRGKKTSQVAQGENQDRWQPVRPVIVALMLLAGGTVLYLPIQAISGRYTMPAVWGLDILLTVLFHQLAGLPQSVWKRAAFAAAGCGLVAVGVASVGKQLKFGARAAFLWDVLEHVERTAPPGARVAWIAGEKLNEEEGIHFAWHLAARGRSDLHIELRTEDGRPIRRVELPASDGVPRFVVTANPTAPAEGWRESRHWTTRVPGRKLRYDCYLWEPREPHLSRER